MTIDRWIIEAEDRIASKEEFIAEFNQMSSRESSWYSMQNSALNANREIVFLKEGIRLLKLSQTKDNRDAPTGW